jgi:hypothetical protein
MDELFIKKVRTAAVAGWWTILIAAGFLFLMWILYQLVIFTQPAWLLCFWGQGITWDDIQSIWLWAIAVFKVGVWLLTLVVVWLTIWGRLLSKK